jgi:hypothetical protein
VQWAHFSLFLEFASDWNMLESVYSWTQDFLQKGLKEFPAFFFFCKSRADFDVHKSRCMKVSLFSYPMLAKEAFRFISISSLSKQFTHTKQKWKAVPTTWKHIILKTGETLEVEENWSEQGYEHSGNETLQNVTNARKKWKCFLFFIQERRLQMQQRQILRNIWKCNLNAVCWKKKVLR